MRNKSIAIVLSIVAALAAVAVVVNAGNPGNPPGPPETTYSYSIEDVYNRLNTGTVVTHSVFAEPSSAPPTGTMHTLDEIYSLMGERAFVPQTGQTATLAAGDDGDLQRGVAWPEPRFVTGTLGVVTDSLTGLVWLQNANCFGGRSWSEAMTYANTLNSGECGLSDGSVEGDWRLPNVRELLSLVDYGRSYPVLPEHHPFSLPGYPIFWSSTAYADYGYSVWTMDMSDGYMSWEDTEWYYYHVWPVRGGQ